MAQIVNLPIPRPEIGVDILKVALCLQDDVRIIDTKVRGDVLVYDILSPRHGHYVEKVVLDDLLVFINQCITEIARKEDDET